MRRLFLAAAVATMRCRRRQAFTSRGCYVVGHYPLILNTFLPIEADGPCSNPSSGWTRLSALSPYLLAMSSLSSRTQSAPAGFIEPCLPSPADKPPSGSNWIHEIKHDGYRMMARRDPVGIRLLTRNGHDWAIRYPLIVEAVNHLKVRSVLIDGEAVCCNEQGLAVFHVLRQRRHEATAFLYAFDLLELNGTDMRREPIEVRKATLASILRKSRPGVRLNEHFDHPDGLAVFQHACQMGLEGIVSKRLGSRYRSGRSPDWLKFKNPEAPAVKREAEEDWGR